MEREKASRYQIRLESLDAWNVVPPSLWTRHAGSCDDDWHDRCTRIEIDFQSGVRMYAHGPFAGVQVTEDAAA